MIWVAMVAIYIHTILHVQYLLVNMYVPTLNIHYLTTPEDSKLTGFIDTRF